MLMPLYGFFEGDFLGLVMIAMPDTLISDIGSQLPGWSLGLRIRPYDGPFDVFNEAGEKLDWNATVEEAGLSYGDIFHVREAA
jgi:hypothetical protein